MNAHHGWMFMFMFMLMFLSIFSNIERMHDIRITGKGDFVQSANERVFEKFPRGSSYYLFSFMRRDFIILQVDAQVGVKQKESYTSAGVCTSLPVDIYICISTYPYRYIYI